MKDKTIDITDYDSFIDNGFKECPKCGWAFDPEFFDEHSCIDMQAPAHNHIEGTCEENEAKGIAECPLKTKIPSGEKKKI